MLTAKWALRRFEKGKQHGLFTLGQCYWGAGRVSELSDSAIKLPAGKSKATALGLASRRGSSDIEPAQDRADTRQQFAQIEGLRQIVISTESETNLAEG